MVQERELALDVSVVGRVSTVGGAAVGDDAKGASVTEGAPASHFPDEIVRTPSSVVTVGS